MKSERLILCEAIKKIIEERGLTQSQAAKVLKIGQPRVSQLMNGNPSYYKTWSLLLMLNNLGFDVEVMVRPKCDIKGNYLEGVGEVRIYL
jgi:predicted XRE-type DNA-binding protein